MKFLVFISPYLALFWLLFVSLGLLYAVLGSAALIRRIAFLGISLFSLPSVLFALHLSISSYQNFVHARGFFANKVEVVRVVASAHWQTYNDWYACRYAVVEFSENTAALLVDHGPKAIFVDDRTGGGYNSWNLNWRQTPVGEWTDNWPEDPLYACLGLLPEVEASLIRKQLNTKGSWYLRDGGGGAFLSSDSRIAATFRYMY